MWWRFALAFAVFAPSADTLRAQSDEGEPSPETATSEVIVVVGRAPEVIDELPLSVGIATFDPLGHAAGISLAEKLQTIAGVVARSRSNFAQDLRLSIRGFGARSPFGIRGIKVVLDGIPLTLADGLAQIDIVDPDLLGRIEVLRGPAGALYGNGSGGVVHLESADPRRHPGVDGSIRINGYGVRKLSARAAYATERTAMSLAFSQLEQDGFRERSASLQRSIHATGEVRLLGAITVAVRGAFLDAPIGQDPGGLTRIELRDAAASAAPNNLRFRAGEAVRQGHVGATTTVRLSDRESAEATLFYSARTFVGSIPFSLIELERDAGGFNATLRSRRSPFGIEGRVILAVEASEARDHRIQFDSDDGSPSGEAILSQDEDVRSLAAYGQVQVSPWRRWQLLAGVRGDSTRFELGDRLRADGDASGTRTLSAVTSMIGIAHQLRSPVTDSATVFGNLANSFEAPTIAELARREGGEPGLDPTLEPQRATNVELGMRAKRGPAAISASVYATRLRGELVPFEDGEGRTFFRNAGRSNRFGLDLEASAVLGRGVRFAIAYSAIRARFNRSMIGGQDFSGNAVPGIPPHRIGAELGWVGLAGLFATTDYEYLRRTPANDAGTARSFSQHVFGVRSGLSGEHSGWRYQAFVGVANLTNADHLDNLRVNAFGERYFEPGWPIHAYAGLRIGWSENTAASAVP